MSPRPLWRCPECDREFANRNQTHSCGRYTLEQHFEGKAASVRAVYKAFLRALKNIGPVRVVPEKSRIAFQVRMSFAQLTPRKSWVDGHLVLARRCDHPKFRAIESLSRRNHVHHFRISTPGEIDSEFVRLMAEAYAVGCQRHLGETGTKQRPSPAKDP